MYKKDFKYFLAFVPALGAVFGLVVGGIWTYSAVIIAFVLVPILEVFFKGDGENFPEAEETRRRNMLFFDILQQCFSVIRHYRFLFLSVGLSKLVDIRNNWRHRECWNYQRDRWYQCRS